jgi:hypothetical protein
MIPLLRVTRQAIWARSSWARLPARFSPMGAAIGGHHTVTVVSITLTLPRTAARTTATVITTARLIMTTTRELTAGMGVLTARTDPRIGAQVIILTRERTLEAALSPLRMAPEAQHKPTIRTPAPMRRRDKVRVQQLNGAARMFREETRALPRVITPLLMELWLVPRLRRGGKRLPRVRSGEIRQPGKRPTVTCTPHTTATFTRTLEAVGRNTTTVAGTM